MFQHRLEIVGVLPQPPDRREGPDCLARTLCVSQLVPDLSFLPLKLLHDPPDQNRVDASGDTPQLRMLLGLDAGQPRLEPCPSTKGLFATTPQKGLLVALQSRQAVRTEELPLQDSDYLGLEAVVPMRPLQLGHSQYQTESLVRRARSTAAIRRLQLQKTIPRRGFAGMPDFGRRRQSVSGRRRMPCAAFQSSIEMIAG